MSDLPDVEKSLHLLDQGTSRLHVQLLTSCPSLIESFRCRLRSHTSCQLSLPRTVCFPQFCFSTFWSGSTSLVLFFFFFNGARLRTVPPRSGPLRHTWISHTRRPTSPSPILRFRSSVFVSVLFFCCRYFVLSCFHPEETVV